MQQLRGVKSLLRPFLATWLVKKWLMQNPTDCLLRSLLTKVTGVLTKCFSCFVVSKSPQSRTYYQLCRLKPVISQSTQWPLSVSSYPVGIQSTWMLIHTQSYVLASYPGSSPLFTMGRSLGMRLLCVTSMLSHINIHTASMQLYISWVFIWKWDQENCWMVKYTISSLLHTYMQLILILGNGQRGASVQSLVVVGHGSEWGCVEVATAHPRANPATHRTATQSQTSEVRLDLMKGASTLDSSIRPRVDLIRSVWKYRYVSLVPRTPPVFVLQFTFNIVHRSRRAVKIGEGLGTLIRQVDVRWT